jgi:hypothetical protein
MGAQAGCHCHNRSGKGVPSADFAGYILRAVTSRLGNLTQLQSGVPRYSAKFCWSSLTRLAESLLPPSRIYRSLFRGPGVRKLAACRFLPAPVLLHTDVLIFNFQAAIPIRDIIIIAQNVSSVKDIEETLFGCTNVRFLREVLNVHCAQSQP